MTKILQCPAVRIGLLNTAIGLLDIAKEFLVRCRDQEMHKLDQSKETNALFA